MKTSLLLTSTAVSLAWAVQPVVAADADSDDDKGSVGTVVIQSQKLQEGSIGGWLPVPVAELPRTVTIIDEELLSKQFISSTKDILKNIPGVQILPDNNLAGYQTPIIRGIQSTQYFEGQYSAGVITSIPEAIGSAEVLQGFNSLQFAIDSGGGSVNYHIKRPTAESFLQTEVQGTNWGGAKLIVDGDWHLDSGETDGIRAVGVVDRDQSYVYDSARKNRNAFALIGRYSGFAGITVDVDFSYWKIKNDPSNPYVSVGIVPDVRPLPSFDPRLNLTQPWSEHAERHGHQLGLRLTRKLGEHWTALFAVAYDRTSYRNDGCQITSPDFLTGEAAYSCSQNSFGPLWDKQVRFDLTGQFATFGLDHYMAVGFRQSGQDWKSINERVDYNDPPYNTQNIYDPRIYPAPTSGTVTPPSNFRSSFKDRLTYIQDRISLGKLWDLWGGAGYVENVGRNGSATAGETVLPRTHALVPTGAVVFKATPSMNYYVSYSEGVSRAEVVSPNDPTIINPGQLLPSIHSRAYEVGGKWTINQRMQVNLALWHQEQPFAINEQVQLNPPRFRRYAGGVSKYDGVSLDFHGKLVRGLELQGGFTVLRAKQSKTQDPALEGNITPGVSRRSGR